MSVIESFKKRIPWFVKIPAKIALSRLPLGLRRWQDLNLFRAGAMDDPHYAFNVFKKHLGAIGRTGLAECTVLELGPGNSLLTALFAWAFGARRTVLVDGERLASLDTSVFVRAERMLSDLGLPVLGIQAGPSMDAVLEQLNATYLTEGLTSIQSLPDGVVDFLFSNAVLEHVRLAQVAPLIQETRRVLKHSGVASHVIDFKDHLQSGLNNLRFSDRVWESEFMARSGFYTNRITWPAMAETFRQAGFRVEPCSLHRWPAGLPTLQRRMALPFRDKPLEELMVMGAHAILRPLT